MNFKEYQSLALVTNADLGSEKLNLAHMVIGMCSELNELETALYNEDVVNISEECTDEFWYLANFCTLLNISLEEFDYTEKKRNPKFMRQDAFIFLTSAVSELSDIVKKHIAYNKALDMMEVKKKVGKISSCLQEIYLIFNLDVQQGLQNNIDKLKVRFGGKFTEHAALNRDLEKELEKKKKTN